MCDYLFNQGFRLFSFFAFGILGNDVIIIFSPAKRQEKILIFVYFKFIIENFNK